VVARLLGEFLCGRCPAPIVLPRRLAWTAHEIPLTVRHALIIAMLLGSTLLVRGETLDREKWVAQIGRANTTCLAKFRQKFGRAKDHKYATCMADQTNEKIETCTGNSEFSNCVRERSLKVLELCDLSKC